MKAPNLLPAVLFLAALLPVPVIAHSPSTGCGPVILAGHDADDHGFESVYAQLFDNIMANVRNGGSGILAIGSDPGSKSGDWVQNVASLMTSPQAVTFANDFNISTTSFSGYAILVVPSDDADTDGGISQPENTLLSARAVDIASFVNGGGGLFGLTQGTLLDGWSYVSVVAPITHLDVDPSGQLPSGEDFDDVTSTPEGQALGINDSNVDGCCFHNVFTSFPAFLTVLAVANEPVDPPFHGVPVYVGGTRICLLPKCGDGVLDPGEECDDGNTLDGDGCSATCTKELHANQPPVIACLPCESCTAPGTCAIPGSCDSIAVCVDPERDATTLSCAPGGPYGLGSTSVVVTCSDGVNTVSKPCAVNVRDCEPPACFAPVPLVLECTSPCGASAADPVVQAWLASGSGSDNCAINGVSHLAATVFPGGCGAGTSSPVAFTVTDHAGYQASCASAVIVRDTLPPTLVVPPPIVLECPGPGGYPLEAAEIQAWLALAHASDLCSETSVSNDAPARFGSGCGAVGATVVVTFTASDGCGSTTSATSTVTVRDTEPPVIADCGLNDLCLWPPNHKYVCFDNARTLLAVQDRCDEGPQISAIECVSDQCDDAPCDAHPGENGDGSTVNDCYWDAASDRLCVRAERAGTEPGGRTYSVTYVALDTCGNESRTAALRFRVPHDQSPHEGCLSAPPGSSE